MASRSKKAPRPVEPTRRLPSRRRRRPRIAGFALRIAGLALVGVLAGCLLFPLASKIVRPYRIENEVEAKVRVLEERLARQSAENAVLMRRIDYLRTDEGKEMLARRAGYHLPGETVFLLSAPPSAAPAEKSGEEDLQ